MSDHNLAVYFAALAIATQFVFLLGVYYAYREKKNVAFVFVATLVLTGMWMMTTFLLAAAGKLRFDTRPPSMLVLLAVTFVIACGIGSSGFGKQLSLGLSMAALIGFQAFRLPLEMLMHRAYTSGLMPVQMSFSGRNFDIVTGVTAALISASLVMKVRVPKPVLWAWNCLGIALLVNVLAIALLSMPTPIRRFHNDPPNTWITQAPYVWVLAVFVLLAVAGHIVITRKLLAASGREANGLLPATR